MKNVLIALALWVSCGYSAEAQPMVKPVQGLWGVLQGPPCPAYGNHHCGTANQQFAYDLVPLDGFGNLAPAFCVGAPIRSPSDGTVIEVLDVYPNLPAPGQHPAGNHVVIQRSPSEYILLAHLSPGSVAVTVGSHVAAGQQVGTCGFNGNTSAPHLHVHMQAAPQVLIFGTPGLPMHFSDGGRLMPGGACVPLGSSPLMKGMVLC